MEEVKTKQKSNKANPILIVFTIILALALLITGSMFAYFYVGQQGYNKKLENMYQKAFYDMLGYMDNLEVNMSKLIISNSNTERQRFLNDISRQAELAEVNLSTLPLENGSMDTTLKYFNQVSDYSKQSSKRLSMGKKLTDEEIEIFEKLYKQNNELKSALYGIADNVDSNFKFMNIFGKKNNEIDSFIDGFKDIENTSMDYPKMIYDGPFSDGLDDREIKGLSLPLVDSNTALKNLNAIFSSSPLTELKMTGETSNNSINLYNFEGKINGREFYAQMTKKGGKLMMFDVMGTCKEEKINENTAHDNALAFLEKTGFKNMKAVWTNQNSGQFDFNFAYEKNKIIFYSDLVKVKVCMETGDIIGLESLTYYYNHVERTISKTALTLIGARQKVNKKLIIKAERLVSIPKSTGEVYAYEFMGEFNGVTYYIYIDANTGEETEVFRVVKGTEGTLLM